MARRGPVSRGSSRRPPVSMSADTKARIGVSQRSRLVPLDTAGRRSPGEPIVKRSGGGQALALVPFFTLQPVDFFGPEFSNGTFSALAESPDNPPSPITYQWQYRNPFSPVWTDAVDGPGPQGTVISGATTDTVSFAKSHGSHSRYYNQ